MEAFFVSFLFDSCREPRDGQTGAVPTPYPLDVPALGDGARQTQTDHVQQQAGDPEEVHGVSDERRGYDVVHEEGPVVWKEHAPGGGRMLTQTRRRPEGEKVHSRAQGHL